MNGKNFIIDRLVNIIKEIDLITVRYVYDRDSKYHVIEFTLANLKVEDVSLYDKLEESFKLDFTEQYPLERLVIYYRGDVTSLNIQRDYFSYYMFKS